MSVGSGPTRGTRASWKGELRFDLVAFRVEAHNVLSSDSEVRFHQLHSECGSRIQYQKVCPIHGSIASEEIVLGYEYDKNRYVEFEPEELEKLRTKSDRALVIDSFIEPDEIDPLYLDGRAYYLLPERAEDQEPYTVLAAAMEHTGRHAIGTVVFAEREQLVLVRPVKQRLAMLMLRHEAEVRAPGELPVKRPREVPRDVELAEQLIAAETDEALDFSSYENRYQKRLARLIHAKIEGRDLGRGEEEETHEGHVVSLTDALERSLERAHAHRPGDPEGGPGGSRRAS